MIDLEVLKDEKIPEAVRSALVEQMYQSDRRSAELSSEQEKAKQDRRSALWNTPLVAAVAGLLTLSATFIFDRISGQDEFRNAVTLEQLQQEIAIGSTNLQQRFEDQSTKTAAEVQALASERAFQYEIVKSELADVNKTNADRAAILLFLVRAGVLSTLDSTELTLMAEEQIENPENTIIPQLSSAVAPTRTVDKIIVGMDSSGIGNPQITPEQVRQVYVETLGWSDVGFHYIVTQSGEIWPFRDINVVPAVAQGNNDGAIGVGLQIFANPRVGDSPYTEVQMEALRKLLIQLAQDYDIPTERIFRVSDYRPIEINISSEEFKNLLSGFPD